MHRRSPAVFAFAITFGLLPNLGGANEPVFTGSSATNIQTLDCDTKAKNFDPFTLGWLVDGDTVDGGEESIRCVTQITNERGKGRKGVKVTYGGEVVDLNGQTIASLGSRSRRTDKAGQTAAEFDLPPGLPAAYLATIEGKYGGGKKGIQATTTCTARQRIPCNADQSTLCLLGDNRFQVEVDWRSSSGSGQGQVISSSATRGTYFFDDNLGELVVELERACANNDHFWVFAAASTDVEVTLKVTDTQTGAQKSYFNPLGQPFRAITDTSAFATCP